MIRKKVCLLGGSSVGKTSLCRRFVHSIFSDSYCTTIGVKIEKKTVDASGLSVVLMLWDMEGDDVFSALNTSYLRGASGLLLVADGTRSKSVEKLGEIYSGLSKKGFSFPSVVAVNKSDLPGCLSLDAPEIKALVNTGMLHALATSAKTGTGVEEAFSRLVQLMLGVEPGC